MTHERRYALCCDALRTAARLDGHTDQDSYIRFFEKDPTAAAGQNVFPLLAALAPIMQEAREAMDKANSSGAVLSALKRIAKACTRDHLRGGWIDDEGRFCVCSGYHAVRLFGARFDSIPTVAGFEGLKKCMERTGNLHRVELPSVADVKTFQAAHGKKEPMPIDEGARYVDPAFLLDMLQALPGATVWTGPKPSSAIWFETDKGDGVLLPVRLPKK